MSKVSLPPLSYAQSSGKSGLQKIVHIDTRLFEDRPQGTFRHVARVIRDGCVFVQGLAEEQLVATGRVAVELKAERPKFSHDLAVAKASKASQSIHAATTMV